MSDRQIDDAIDSAVRGMMNVDADPAFRARVLARLDRRAPRTLHWLRVAAVPAVVAAVLLAFVVARRPAPVPTVASPGRNLAVPATPERPAPAGAASAAAAPVAPSLVARQQAPPQGITHAVPPGALIAAVAEAASVGAMDGLTAIDPIGITPLGQAPIGSSELVVAPLAPITEVQIAPFDPRHERD